MNRRVLSGPIAWLLSASLLYGCSPFFPELLLDNPEAGLGRPPVPYFSDLAVIVGPKFLSNRQPGNVGPFQDQIVLEMEEMETHWKLAGKDAAAIHTLVEQYRTVRSEMAVNLAEAGLKHFPAKATPHLAARSLGAEFPADVADYVEAARLYGAGDAAAARLLWKAVLERPVAERRLRGTWCAWMLAKTSPDDGEALGWYARVTQEAEAGGADILQLSTAAKAWRGPRTPDAVEGFRLLAEAVSEGQQSAIPSLRARCRNLFKNADAGAFSRVAANPSLRKIMNLEVQASGARYEDDPESLALWLKVLTATCKPPLDEGVRLAWALYDCGDFAGARTCLDLSKKDDPSAIWLQAKFDLREGKLTMADKHLTEATRKWSGTPGWAPCNSGEESMDWYRNDGTIRSHAQALLVGDTGIVALARMQYSRAFEAFTLADFDEDAAYVAERLLTLGELRACVAKSAPAWEPLDEAAFNASLEKKRAGESSPGLDHGYDGKPVEPHQFTDPAYGWTGWRSTPANRLRYLFARRLAREGHLDEAARYMPPALGPLFDHYRELDRARRSGKYRGDELAAITWRQARIHYFWGRQLFVTEGAPDGGVDFYGYPSPDIAGARMNRASDRRKDGSTPGVGRDEMRRLRAHPLPDSHRGHYRFTAANLAWKAAALLPKDHPELPALYNQAGRWLAIADPKAADRFYQALVKRCSGTPEGRNADTRRWFVPGLSLNRDLRALPGRFQLEKQVALSE